jgi:Spy/CpxP family protein refolding chaperone
MKKALLILTTITSLAFATQTTPANMPGNGKSTEKQMKKGSPFLINGKMPHLTKLVMKNWDKLNLSDKQQAKLITIRKETMGAIKSIKPQIIALEKEVAIATMAGEKPETLKNKVDTLAKLKASATMAHIKCIYETQNVLTPDQLAQLKK